MDAKLLTNGYSIGGVYSSSALWAFVEKVGDDYKLLHDPMSCKDYTHEIICNTIHNEALYRNGCSRVLPIDLEKLQFVMVLGDTVQKPDTFKEVLYSAKKVFSDMEAAAGLPKTLVREVTPDNPVKGVRTFLFTAKKHFIESPVLLHVFIGLMRTVIRSKETVNKKDIVAKLNGNGREDSYILIPMFKTGALELMLKEHKTIFAGGIDLKKIYPKQSESNSPYHSGFGPVALQEECLCSKWYGDKLYKLLKDNKISLNKD